MIDSITKGIESMKLL